jgi:hypothetical protein
MRPGLILGAVALLFAEAAPRADLAAQEQRLARLSAAARTQVEAVLDSARREGLPTEPLVDRALEGASKRADDARIVAAVRRLAGDLGAARDALGTGVSDAEIGAGASALRAGARPGDLTRVRAGRPGHSVTVAVAVLTDLVALGVPADTATLAVLALAESDDAAYLAFRRSVERDVALGATPVAALTYRLAGDGLAIIEADAPPRPRKP